MSGRDGFNKVDEGDRVTVATTSNADVLTLVRPWLRTQQLVLFAGNVQVLSGQHGEATNRLGHRGAAFPGDRPTRRA